MTRAKNRAFLLGALVALVAAAPQAATRIARAPRAGGAPTGLTASPDEQARAALEREAQRRDARFREAADPGSAFAATRVPQAEIDRGERTAEELFAIGAQLFDLQLSPEVGLGGRDLPAFRRVHAGRRGGPDASRCASCHWRGGPAGAGDAADNAYLDGDGDAPRSALERNAPSLAGAGVVQLLGEEMSRELARERDALVSSARAHGRAERAPLVAKGISFGAIGADARGAVDLGDVRGVDPDLVVKPFGRKGTFASLRDVVEDELNVHHGMQTVRLGRTGPAWRVGPFGAPDPDGDGVIDEVSDGQLTALTLFVAMQELPVERVGEPPAALGMARGAIARVAEEGRARFDALGCATCHAPALALDATRFVDGAFTVDLAVAGAEPRLPAPGARGARRIALYSDLRRHHMGPVLAEARGDRGVANDAFLTPPLWGMARSAPYLHDGRAPTVEDAITLHGGEAQASRDAFLRLTEEERAPLRVFLASLTRAARVVAP